MSNRSAIHCVKDNSYLVRLPVHQRLFDGDVGAALVLAGQAVRALRLVKPLCSHGVEKQLAGLTSSHGHVVMQSSHVAFQTMKGGEPRPTLIQFSVHDGVAREGHDEAALDAGSHYSKSYFPFQQENRK